MSEASSAIIDRIRWYNHKRIDLPLWGKKPAAVAVVTRLCEQNIDVLLTVRAANLGVHAGEVGLPGGHTEKNESTLQTAIRELKEETGVDESDVEYIGALDDTCTITGFRITPHVFIIKESAKFRPDKAEVEELFWMPLHLLDSATNYNVFLGQEGAVGSFPLLTFRGKVVWGATARVLKNLHEVVSNKSSEKDPFRKFYRFLKSHNAFLLTTHVNSDPDGMGCEVALGEVIRSLGKKASILNPGGWVNKFRFLKPSVPTLSGFRQLRTTAKEFDALCILDCSSSDRLGEYKGVLDMFPVEHRLLMDHHSPGDIEAGVSIVDSSSSSTAQILLDFLERMWFPIEGFIADALLGAIMFDTYSFRYSADSTALEAGARLIKLGANLAAIQENLFAELSFDHLRVLAYVIPRVKFEFDGKLAWAYLSRQEIEELGVRDEDVSDLAHWLAQVDRVKVAVVLRERPDGRVRLSYRTKSGYPLLEVVRKLGGGGHPHAGGAVLSGGINEAMQLVREYVKNMLSEA